MKTAKAPLDRITARARAVIEKMRLGYELRCRTTPTSVSYHLVKRGCKGIEVDHRTVTSFFNRELIKFDRLRDGKGVVTNRFYVLRKEYK